MDYIRNSKNRKIKTQILQFFSRLSFGTYRLDLIGKTLLFLSSMTLVSLFFPWIEFRDIQGDVREYWAFSLYLGWIGYGIIIGIFTILFFLLSHQKKEFLRSYVPFRLSDAQAIVFIASILLALILQLIIITFAYSKIASIQVSSGFGLELGLGLLVLVIIFSFFFSQHEKTKAVSMGYLDKKDFSPLDEYQGILGSTSGHEKKQDDKNMTLPI